MANQEGIECRLRINIGNTLQESFDFADFLLEKYQAFIKLHNLKSEIIKHASDGIYEVNLVSLNTDILFKLIEDVGIHKRRRRSPHDDENRYYTTFVKVSLCIFGDETKHHGYKEFEHGWIKENKQEV